MRGGTSRGPYFNRAELPEDEATLTEVLIAAIGAGHPLCIDGIGGAESVTTKVAMLSRSDHDWAEIDYFFAQVGVTERVVDYSPSCGNILSGVGAAALEMGLVQPDGDETLVKIRNTNTGALIEAIVQTPGGAVQYDGDTAIDGVPGTAAPVMLNFMKVVGSKTGSLLPTGNPTDEINGITVTCIDAAMPMVIGRATDFGVTGYEDKPTLDANGALYKLMEPIRREAGEQMGLGDVSDKVIPKFGLLAAPRDGGSVTSRYFIPHNTHPSHAVTGAICVGACVMAPGTVADGIALRPNSGRIRIEHPSGAIDVAATGETTEDGYRLDKAGLLRTCRLLMRGEVMVPARVWTR